LRYGLGKFLADADLFEAVSSLTLKEQPFVSEKRKQNHVPGMGRKRRFSCLVRQVKPQPQQRQLRPLGSK
jgi:hypothetical protein